jgi:hypothetical protein
VAILHQRQERRSILESKASQRPSGQVTHATSDGYLCAAEQQQDSTHPGFIALISLYLFDSHGESKANWKMLRVWMADATAGTAWDHTMHVMVISPSNWATLKMISIFNCCYCQISLREIFMSL